MIRIAAPFSMALMICAVSASGQGLCRIGDICHNERPDGTVIPYGKNESRPYVPPPEKPYEPGPYKPPASTSGVLDNTLVTIPSPPPTPEELEQRRLLQVEQARREAEEAARKAAKSHELAIAEERILARITDASHGPPFEYWLEVCRLDTFLYSNGGNGQRAASARDSCDAATRSSTTEEQRSLPARMLYDSGVTLASRVDRCLVPVGSQEEFSQAVARDFFRVEPLFSAQLHDCMVLQQAIDGGGAPTVLVDIVGYHEIGVTDDSQKEAVRTQLSLLRQREVIINDRKALNEAFRQQEITDQLAAQWRSCSDLNRYACMTAAAAAVSYGREQEALWIYERACELHLGEGCFRAANYYRDGVNSDSRGKPLAPGTGRDLHRANELYNKACHGDGDYYSQPYAQACSEASKHYLSAEETAALDHVRAFRLRQGAGWESKYRATDAEIERFYKDRREVAMRDPRYAAAEAALDAKRIKKGIDALEQLALEHNGFAEERLAGILYWGSYGQAVNSSRALALYEDSASLGIGEAAAFLGDVYHNGSTVYGKVVVKPDEVLAIEWIEKGIAAGDLLSKKWAAAFYSISVRYPE